MKYEYRVITNAAPAPTLEVILNELGQEGFRIIAVTEICDQDGSSTGDTVYLMREVPSNP